MEQLITISEILNSAIEDNNYIFYAMVYRPTKNISINGNPYINCILKDKNDFVQAKKWNIDNIDESLLKHGKVLKINAKLKLYKGSWQLIINFVEIINDQEIISFVLPTAIKPNDVMWEEFNHFFDEIKDKDYKKIIDNIFDKEMIKKFRITRAGLSIHHDVIGGLLWHTLSILKTSEKICEIYSELKINKSLLFAGIIFHDIGKIYEIGDFSNEMYSLHGNLVGHISISSALIYKVGSELKIPEEKIYTLQHLILSSHGKLENGSPIEPKMIESLILSKLDDLDSKLNSVFKFSKNTEEGNSTEKIRTLNNNQFYISKKDKE